MHHLNPFKLQSNTDNAAPQWVYNDQLILTQEDPTLWLIQSE